MPSLMRLAARTAVITGAASGIGRALALALAQRRCHLALADIDAAGLTATATAARSHGVRVTSYQVDVADRAAVSALSDQVLTEHGGVDLLFNNAGVAVGGSFEQVSEEDFEWLFAINFHGLVRMTRAFLPTLRRSDDARIINMSSVFGIIAPPGETAYAASKFAVRGFSESLRHELWRTNVGVTVVHPGGVATSIAERARAPQGVTAEEIEQHREKFRRFLRLPPQIAAETVIRGVERRQSRVLVGYDAHGIAWLTRLLPVSYWRLLRRYVPE